MYYEPLWVAAKVPSIAMAQRKSILVVDNEPEFFADFQGILDDLGYDSVYADSSNAAVALLGKRTKVDCVIIDATLATPPGQCEPRYHGGVWLGRWIRRNRRNLAFIGCSGWADQSTREWFARNGAGFLSKPDAVKPARIRPLLCRALNEQVMPRCFIVHGRDPVILELKNFVQNRLRLPEPIVLREQADGGLTIIEKFEHYAEGVDLVFVLLAPEDRVVKPGEKVTNDELRRARQNVIFEMGFFVAKLGRRSGRVLLLSKGSVELPSDIHGVVQIDITNGVESAATNIQRQLDALCIPWGGAVAIQGT
jgi:predicted nucleotide-binding protein